MAALAAARPDVIILASHIPDGIAFRQAMLAAGLHVGALIGSTMAECDPDFAAELGSAAVGIFASDRPTGGFQPTALDPSARALYERLAAAWAKASRGTISLAPGASSGYAETGSGWGASSGSAGAAPGTSAPAEYSITGPVLEGSAAAGPSEEALSGFSAAWVLAHDVLPAAASVRAEDIAAAARQLDLPTGSLPNGAGVRFSSDAATLGQNERAAAVIWQWQAVRRYAFVLAADVRNRRHRLVATPAMIESLRHTPGAQTRTADGGGSGRTAVGPLARAFSILAALAVVVGLRWAATVAGAADALTVGLGFGAGLAAVAIACGASIALPNPRAVVIGLVGGSVLVVVALVNRQPGLDLGLRPAAPFVPWAAVTLLVASAEEAIVRGAAFDAIERIAPTMWGTAGAVLLTSIAFALMHVPIYGWHVVPLDIGVGVFLGGLRLLTGGVAAPAAAHAVADLATWWL